MPEPYHAIKIFKYPVKYYDIAHDFRIGLTFLKGDVHNVGTSHSRIISVFTEIIEYNNQPGISFGFISIIISHTG